MCFINQCYTSGEVALYRVGLLFCVVQVLCAAACEGGQCEPLSPRWWGEAQVGVMHLSSVYGTCLATYDVRSINLVHVYAYNDAETGKRVELKVVQPFIDVLKNHLLQSRVFKCQTSLQSLSTDFCFNDVCLSAFYPVEFVSSAPDLCVFNAYEPLQALGRVHIPARAIPLVPEAVRHLQEGSDAQMRWEVVSTKTVRRAMRQSVKDGFSPAVFVFLRDGYAFRGHSYACSSKPLTIERNCLLYHKITRDPGAMEREYGFSEEKAASCLNYKDGRILWG